ncbi:MAG TPA: hypothetical protein VID03_09575 [Acidimicrobiia bacterium]|jgi:hypothetical protein
MTSPTTTVATPIRAAAPIIVGTVRTTRASAMTTARVLRSLPVSGSKASVMEDPAHQPVEGRHIHRELSIHVEPPGSEHHSDGSAS